MRKLIWSILSASRGRMVFLALLILLFSREGTLGVNAQTFSLLSTFGRRPIDPANPSRPGIIAQGRDGSLYSTAGGGDAQNDGVVFRITPAGKVAVLYRFDGTQGSGPVGGLTLGTDGNLYGAAIGGGTYGHGTLFKVSPSGYLTVLYNFTGGTEDQGAPVASPIQGSDGNFYGTTEGGGNLYGTVYKMTPNGVLTTIYHFQFNVAWNCLAPLVLGTDGNFYGTTQAGSFGGTVFRITPKGNFTLLYALHDDDGLSTVAPLVQGTDGNFYGTATGGLGNAGTVFKITPTGTLTVIHSFTGDDGSVPYGGLVLATNGYFYGTTMVGGEMGYGVIFRVSPEGDFSVLHGFDSVHGANPLVTLLHHTNGILYGDTIFGGRYNKGIFYSFNDGLGPFVGLLSTTGKVGKTIQILGQGFTGTTDVLFHGTSAVYTVVTDTFLKAAVPPGASSGFVTVVTPSGILKSNKKFRVKP